MPHLFIRFSTLSQEAGGDFKGILDVLVQDGEEEPGEGYVEAAALGDFVAAQAPWASDPANVTALVPAAEVLALTCAVPGRTATQLRRAAPYAVEEFITEDIEAMHVACGDLVRGEPVRCLVTPRARMGRWLACLAAADIEPGLLTADAAALPGGAETVTVLFEGDHALVRGGDQVADVDVENLSTAIAGARAALGEVERPTLRLLNGRMSESDALAAGFEPEDVPTPPAAVSVLRVLAESIAQESASPINLAQGDFAVKRRVGGAWAHWRPAAALAGIALAFVLALTTAEGVWASYKANALREEVRALYREVFATDRVPGNPARAMRSRLGQAPVDTPGFHRLLGELGVALQAGGRHELRSVTFSERNGLVAEIMVADYDTVEELQKALAQRGLLAEVGSSEQQEGRVRANLRIAPSG